MAEEKTYVFGNDGANSMLPFAMNNGGFGGWGGGLIGLIAGLLFGGLWGGNGFGGWGGNGAGAAGMYANDSATRDLIIQGINGNHDAISTLSSTLHADLNSVESAISTLSVGLANVGAQVGMSGLQVVNAIQAGDASLSRQLCECCCENRLLTTQSGYENRIQTIEQTNQLGSQADRNTRSITDAIAAQTTMITKEFCDLKERELQDKIVSLTAANATLKSQIDNAAQTAAIESYVAALVNPVISDVREIKAAQPATVTVQYPQLTVVPATSVYGNGSFNYGVPYGNGYWN
jgi:hypothetical protein